MINLELTEQERTVLLEAIESYISELRMEISDTDSLDFREMLKARREVLSRILEYLGNEEQVPVLGHL